MFENVEEVPLGSRAKDRITGFEGIVTGNATYLHGCGHILIKPEGLDKDNKMQEGQWFDVMRIELVVDQRPDFTGDVEVLEKAPVGVSGGPMLDTAPPA